MAGCKEKYIAAIYQSKVSKQPKSAEVNSGKHPRSSLADGFYQKTPIWAFSKCDVDHEKWGIAVNGESLKDVILKLRSFEGMKWSEILSDNSGRKKRPKNSEKEITAIIKDAQKRFEILNLHREHDSIYSFAIDGKARLWGVRTENVFYVVWIDPDHEIYPVEKSHT